MSSVLALLVDGGCFVSCSSASSLSRARLRPREEEEEEEGEGESLCSVLMAASTSIAKVSASVGVLLSSAKRMVEDLSSSPLLFACCLVSSSSFSSIGAGDGDGDGEGEEEGEGDGDGEGEEEGDERGGEGEGEAWSRRRELRVIPLRLLTLLLAAVVVLLGVFLGDAVALAVVAAWVLAMR